MDIPYKNESFVVTEIAEKVLGCPHLVRYRYSMLNT